MKKIVIAAIIAICASSASLAQENTTFPSLAPVLEKVMPGIVNVAVQGDLSAANMPPVARNHKNEDDDDEDTPPRRSFGKPRKFESLGSGVIIDAAKGYIITNDHVIHNAKTITITLNDGRRLKARLIGADEESDVAVVQIKADHLYAIPNADSDKLRVGEFVVAIGNPFGLNSFGNSQTATFGIISALQRSDLNIEGVENFIQTDAAINPGNSGGALIDTDGKLIGINTAIIAPYGGNVGIGFAIPINMALNVAEQLIKYGSIHRGLMGIYVQHLTPELANAFGIEENLKGAVVTQVNNGSPAEQAGLKPGDIILSINDTKVSEAAQVRNTISLLRVGSTAHMQIFRNNQTINLSAVVTDFKQNQQQLQSRNPFLYGLALRTFEQESPLHGQVTGAQVVGLSEYSAGWRAGNRPGDVIVSANQQPVTDVASLQKIANSAKNQLLVHILRGPGALFFVIK